MYWVCTMLLRLAAANVKITCWWLRSIRARCEIRIGVVVDYELQAHIHIQHIRLVEMYAIIVYFRTVRGGSTIIVYLRFCVRMCGGIRIVTDPNACTCILYVQLELVRQNVERKTIVVIVGRTFDNMCRWFQVVYR